MENDQQQGKVLLLVNHQQQANPLLLAQQQAIGKLILLVIKHHLIRPDLLKSVWPLIIWFGHMHEQHGDRIFCTMDVLFLPQIRDALQGLTLSPEKSIILS